jgi:hypothetical protein
LNDLLSDPYLEHERRQLVEKIKTKKYKANYRCIQPHSMYVPTGCPDFFLPYRTLEADKFVCPTCGTKTIMPLF